MLSALSGNCVEKTTHGRVWCANNCNNDAGTHLLPCWSQERTQSPRSGIHTVWLFPLREPQFAQRKVFDALYSLLLCQNIVIAQLFLCVFPSPSTPKQAKGNGFCLTVQNGVRHVFIPVLFLVDVFVSFFCHVHPEHKMYLTTNTICIAEYSWYTN